MNNISFNLVREPWIPCSRSDGSLVKLSLLEFFLQAHQLREIAHPSPLVSISLLRVLLAILHRALDGPKSVEEWYELWKQPALPETPIRSYLDAWAHRFDLFDTERPFFQDPTLRNYDEKTRGSVNKLFHQKASGNNDTLFDHSLDSHADGVPFDEAALQLIATQAFALGGLVTPDPSSPKETKSAEGSPAVKAILFAIAGENLRETLLLNLTDYDPAAKLPWGSESDRPAWEKPASSCLATRTPQGKTDLLTWQSRRIAFFRANGRISKAVIMKGEQTPESFALRSRDAMMAWKLVGKQNKQTWAELNFQPDRGVWRDAHSLYATETANVSRPPVLDWIANLTANVLDENASFALSARGLNTDRAKILSWHAERLPLTGRLLKQPQLVNEIKTSQETADATAQILRTRTADLAKILLRPQNSDQADKNAVAALSSALSRREQFWSEMESAFHRLVSRLAAEDEDSRGPSGHTKALESWMFECRDAARLSMAGTLSAAGRSARTYRAVAMAETRFRRDLRKTIPLAFNGDSSH